MKLPALLLVAALLADAAAQTSSTPPVAPGAITTRAKQNQTTRSTAPKGKVVLPDPDLLDGSKYDPEKRPLYGMLSEIEMGEQESDQQDRVGPNSGPAGEPKAGEENKPGGGPQPEPIEQGKEGSAAPIEQGPAAQAQGAQAQQLSGPQSSPADGGPQGGARDMQIGDATLQIPIEAKTPDVVGQEASKAQQYEKPVPAGQQSNTRNQGVEKGKVIPKGL